MLASHAAVIRRQELGRITMTLVTRRGLLGGAALGTIGLAACQTKPKGRPAFAGEVGFLHGVASGDPLHDRMILWTRVTPVTGAGTVPVDWVITEAGKTEPAASGTFETSEARDFTVKVDVAGLKPATAYTYRFSVLTDGGTVTSSEGRALTTAAGGEAPVRLGVVSCANWQFGLFTAYGALASETDLDAIVHLGDYMYEYGTDGYGGHVAAKIGRPHDPPTQSVSLAHYRRR